MARPGRGPLLRQPHCFEGLIAVEEDADATDLAVNEVVDVRTFSTGHDPAGATSRSEPYKGDRIAVTYCLHALHLDPKVRAYVLDVGEEPLDPISSQVLGPSQRHQQLHILGTEREVGANVSRIDRRDGPPDCLDVLLRHRLPLQPEVGEGAVAGEVRDEPRHLAVADVKEGRPPSTLLPEVHPVCLAATADGGEDEDALVVKLSKLLCRDAKTLRGAYPPAPSLAHRGDTSPAAWIGSVGQDKLDLVVSPLRGGEVAALPRLNDRAHEVQVLRHRLPSLLGEAFGGGTGLVNVGVGRQSHEQAIGRPVDGPSLLLMDLTIEPTGRPSWLTTASTTPSSRTTNSSTSKRSSAK